MAEDTSLPNDRSNNPASQRGRASSAGTAADRGAEAARTVQDAASDAADQTRQAVEGERRSFAENTDQASRVASSALNAGQDMARQGADAARRLADESRRTGTEVANIWREAWDPVFRAHMEATRWFDETWRQLTGFSAHPGLQTARPFNMSPAPLFGAPPVDVRETNDAYEIVVEAPGVPRESLEVKLESGLLTISGQKLDAIERTGGTYRLSERRFGGFSRSFPVPPDTQPEQIEASHEDGVLTIRVPKTEGAREPTKRIEIH